MVVTLTALVFAVTGLAVAGISAPDDTITACVAKKKGALRVIKASKSCGKKERQITWNRRGPAGPQGVIGPQGPPGEAGAPASKLWAGVLANGNLSRGSGVVSTEKVSTGLYEITFNQNVSQCGFFPALGNPTNPELAGGEIGAAQNIGGGFAGLPTQVAVSTLGSSGVTADRPFFISVIC